MKDHRMTAAAAIIAAEARTSNAARVEIHKRALLSGSGLVRMFRNHTRRLIARRYSRPKTSARRVILQLADQVCNVAGPCGYRTSPRPRQNCARYTFGDIPSRCRKPRRNPRASTTDGPRRTRLVGPTGASLPASAPPFAAGARAGTPQWTHLDTLICS
jgi:hypothetical protein